jgi:tetratricopeptide (TPR) repeat protein
LSLWPDSLCLDYGWPVAHTLGDILPGALVIGLLASATIWGLTRRQPWAFLGAWFLVILTPSSSVVPLAQLAFEHRMYLSLAAVVTAVVVGGYVAGMGLVQRGWLRGRAVLVSEACLVTFCAILLGFLTVKRNVAYQTPLSIWQDTVAKAPRNPSARNNLGCILTSVGRVAEAMEQYLEAVRLEPEHAITHNNLANALVDSQRLPEAIEHYEEAVRLEPDYAKAHNNLANTLTKTGRESEAIEHYQAVLRTCPDDLATHCSLAGVLMSLGFLPEAIEHYQQALKLDPQSAETHNNLAIALLKADRLPQALEQFEQAARLNPELVDVHYNLAKAMAKAGRIGEAIEHGRKAIRLAPDQARVYRFVAWLMATHEPGDGGDPQQAMRLAEHACVLIDRRDVLCLDTLAAAYAAAGRFAEAESTAKEAWQLAQAAGQDTLAEEFHMRLQLYRDRKPFREPVGDHANGRP